MTSLDQSQPQASYSVGTLSYNRRQLVFLFFWLMWNDFSITLIEQIGSMTNFVMKDHGATNTQIALMGTVGSVFFWINPWVSTWSDRLRSKWGRRRPFLLIAAPFFAFFLAATPYMPSLYHYLLRNPFMVALSARFPMSGEVLFMGVSNFFCGIFNAVILAIFSYLYWDVVPEPVMGRFQALSKTVALMAGLAWSFWIWGLADHHLKAVYAVTSAFCLTIYLISVWQIKEGEYPPPDVHKKGGLVAPIRAYIVESFSKSYYLWIFVASLFFQIAIKAVNFNPTIFTMT